jgi:hypothetical protein
MCQRGKSPLGDEVFAEICSLTTPFDAWSARWEPCDSGGEMLVIYNLDTHDKRSPHTGARFWPRADYDTDAAIEFISKLIPYPYRVEIAIIEGAEDHRGWKYDAYCSKTTDVGTSMSHGWGEVLPLALLSAGLQLLATMTELHEIPSAEDHPPPQLPDLPTSSEAPESTFEDLPA